MKRVNQHIIEDESRKAFANLVPNEWVLNDFQKDYGKDIHVEIFSNYMSTGRMFIVQLKASNQIIKNNKISIKIKVDALQYYQSIEIPVLLCFYSTRTKSFWGVWANALMSSIEVVERQNMTTITLSESNLIDKPFFYALEKTLDSNTPFKFNVSFNALNTVERAFSLRIQKWLEKYYKNYYEIKNQIYPTSLNISINENSNSIAFEVTYNNSKFDIKSIEGKNEISFIHKLVVVEDDISEYEAEMLFLITSFFSEFSPASSLSLLRSLLPIYKGQYNNSSTLQEIAKFALRKNCIYELQQLIEVTIEHLLFNEFQHLNSVLFNQKRLFEKYRTNLIHAIKAFEDSKFIGVFYYNLANHYRHYSEYHLSVSNFIKAKRATPAYLKKYYWWHEIAGVFYLSGHYKWAETCYRNSIQMDSDKIHLPLTYALLGDCQFMQLKFSEAALSYNDYIETVYKSDMNYSGQYAFMHTLCCEFITSGFHDRKYDRDLSYFLLETSINEGSDNKLKEAICAYPLNHNAWYLSGVNKAIIGSYSDAISDFLNAALIKIDNIKYWGSCIFAILNCEIEFRKIIPAIISVCLEIFGKKFLNDLIQFFSENTQLTNDELQELTIYFFEISNKN